MIFGWGNGNGFGNGGGTAAYDTGAGMQRGFDTQTIIGKLDGLNNGVCSLGYDQLNQMNGINMNIASLGAQLNNAICTTNFNTQQGFNTLTSALQGCCCDVREAISGVNYNNAMNANATQSAIAQTNYNLATQSCETRSTINDGVRAIIDKLNAQEMAAKDAQIAAQNQQIFGLQLQASQAEQSNYLINQIRPCPIPSFQTCNPWASTSYVGYGNCNSGCCGCNG